MLLSVPLVATLFQYGKFTAFDTHMAAMSVFGLSFGLPAFALLKIVLPAFYARQDTTTPVRAGIVALVSNMVLNLLFLALLYQLMVKPEVRALGVTEALARTPGLHLALGIASAVASYINLGLLWMWLRRAGVISAARAGRLRPAAAAGVRGDGRGGRRRAALASRFHRAAQADARPRSAGPGRGRRSHLRRGAGRTGPAAARPAWALSRWALRQRLTAILHGFPQRFPGRSLAARSPNPDEQAVP